MSLSCQISCFPPIQEHCKFSLIQSGGKQQLALGELLVEKKIKIRQGTSISFIFYIIPFKGTRSLSISHLRWLFYNGFLRFFSLDITLPLILLFCFGLFLLSSATGSHRGPSSRPSISCSSQFGQVPPWAALKTKGYANPRAVSDGYPATPLPSLL